MTLYERLRFRLRMLRLGLTIRPVAGGEETEEEKAAREKREAEEAEAKKKAEEEAKKKPPWGDDENFDAERAWKLIQDLRGDVAKVKSENEELRTWKQKREDADKTDDEKREERATKAEKEAAENARDAARLRVALKKGLTETQAKRLVGDSEEDLEKDADELLASFKQEEEESGGGTTRRPKERLRPGAAPSSEPEETDPRKLADQVPQGY